MDKGTLSNWASAAVLGASFALPEGMPRTLAFTTGMYALCGGLTNWLAVKMLFDRIPGFIGSGVVTARFREIRASVKDVILEHFFSPEHLERFFAANAASIDWRGYLKAPRGGDAPLAGAVRAAWKKLTSGDALRPVIDAQIEKLTDSPIGGLLLMVGLDTVRPAVHNFVGGFVGAMEERVVAAAASIDPGSLDVELDRERLVKDARLYLDRLLQAKMEELQASQVKAMVEEMIRSHLGWLVVWGNVLGGILGLLAYFLQPWIS